MKHFAIRVCPLCSKKLKQGDEDSLHTYYCEEFYLRYAPFDFNTFQLYNPEDYTGGKVREPHYSVDIESGIWKQSTIIPPYWIISTSDSNTSKVYKFGKEISAPNEKELLMEVPLIVPSDYVPEAFAKKIKNLVIFT
jgi:hypothetical protein